MLIDMSAAVLRRTQRPRAERDRRAEDRARAHRVQRLDLKPCVLCGGTDDDVAALDETLACQCAARRAQLNARIARMRREHVDPVESARDRVAP